MNEMINPETTSAGRLAPGVLSASSLIGDDVYNMEGEKLGDIKELMIDVENGEVRYAVLSFGGFLSLGEKLFAMPWSALTLDTDNRRFIIDADEERLQNAPGFDANNWPNMADTSWENSVHDYYGTRY